MQYPLLQVVCIIKRDNRLVADFQMTYELWEAEEVREDRLAISATARWLAHLSNLQVD